MIKSHKPCLVMVDVMKPNYQTVQVWFGGVQPNVLLNSGKLETGTRTLK